MSVCEEIFDHDESDCPSFTTLNPSYNQRTTELNLNYLIKEFDARVMFFYNDTRFNAVQQDVKRAGVGIQVQK